MSMTPERQQRIGQLCALWIAREFQRRALKADRAKAMKIAIKLGAGVDHEQHQAFHVHHGTLIADEDDDRQVAAVARVHDLNAQYQEAANRARSLRASITKLCQGAGVVIARPSKDIAAELAALDPPETLP